MPNTQTVDTASFALEIRSATLDEEKRTVEAIWSAGAPVKRHSFDEGDFMEELSMDPAHVRLERLNAGASLLDNHGQYSIASRLGAVVKGSAQIRNGVASCQIKFSTRQEAQTLLNDLANGIPISLSVGYRVHAFERTEGEDNEIPVLRAIDWEPFEISAVCIPADIAAQTRNEDTHMPNSQTKQTKKQSIDQILTLERGLELIEHLGDKDIINRAFLARQMKKAPTEQEFRNAIVDAMAESDGQIEIRSHADLNDGSHTNSRASMIQGLIARVDSSVELIGSARSYRGISLNDIMVDCLQNDGQSTRGLSKSDLVSRAMSTSDFPILMKSFADQRLLAGYAMSESPLKRLGRQDNYQDFRDKMAKSVSDMPGLAKKNEAGEYKFGSFDEKGETHRALTYGRIIGITRELLINDDLGGMSRITTGQGQAVARLEADLIAALIESNPNLSDGKPVFDESEGTAVSTGTQLNAENIASARKTMRTQKNRHGSIIDIAPEYLIVHPELEYAAEKLLADVAATNTDDANVLAGKLELVVEPRFESESAWYLSASPSRADGFEYGNVENEQSPYAESRQRFETDDLEFKIRHDFGCGFVDRRSWFKNPGA